VNDLEALTTARQLCALTDRELGKVARLTRETFERLLERDRNVGALLIQLDELGKSIKAAGGADSLPQGMSGSVEQLFLAGVLVAKESSRREGVKSEKV
jgi:hypothetical protein